MGIIGNIMGIVIDVNESNTSINRNIDILRNYLRSNNVPTLQIDKAVSFMRYRKTKQGSLTRHHPPRPVCRGKSIYIQR